mmetsp:Transcript_6536/g.19506  ORF Transcript_6536/g.19506 Transcript_6536/m.19506 type:complete len:99 (-) Transcript_6536:1560-1856(-)
MTDDDDDDNARVFDERSGDDDVFNIFPFVRWGNDICVADPERKHFDATDAHTRRKRENEPKKRGTTHFLFSMIPEMSSKDDDDDDDDINNNRCIGQRS